MNKIASYTLVIVLCFCQLAAQAQRRSRTDVKKEPSFTLFEVLPVVGKGYVSVFTDDQEVPSSVRLVYTGTDGEVKQQKEISLIRRGLSAMVEGAFIWDGELTLITSLFYPGPQRDLLFIRRYGLPDFAEVASEKVAEAYVPGRLRVPFGYDLSPDSTKIMFYSWSYAVPEDPVKMEIHVFDRQLERLWNKRFLLANKNENFYIYACQVDNAGNAYLLCEDYKGKIGPGTRIKDEKIERFVLRLDEDSNEAVSFGISITDKVITDLRFTMDERGNLYGAGIYREKNKIFQTGVFAYRIDRQTQGFKKREIPINRDDYQDMHAYTDESGKFISGTRQFRDYYLDRLVWDDEEGLTLIAEQRIYDNDQDQYNDIMVVQLDTSLRKSWTVRVPKSQSARWGQANFASYRFLQRAGKMYLLFNDDLNNLPSNTELPSRIKKLDFVYSIPEPFIHLVQISNSGKLQHHNISSVIQTNSAMGLVPILTRSDRSNVFLLYLNYIAKPDEMGEVFPISWVKD